jgi:hypothetical protein
MVAGTVGDRGAATGRLGTWAKADSRGRPGSRGPAARAARGGREPIDDIQAMTVQTLVAEAVLDMSRWPTESHFVSWIGLAPRNEVTGGKLQKDRTRGHQAPHEQELSARATWVRSSGGHKADWVRCRPLAGTGFTARNLSRQTVGFTPGPDVSGSKLEG